MQNLYIKIPDGANVVIDKLYENGHSAFVVGGCVRDFILEKEPHDWDICTDALPEQVMQIFGEKNVIPTGIKHGTVTVLIGNDNYEVTTYRIDGMYSDGRRPDNVEFTQNLIEDLSRRDFPSMQWLTTIKSDSLTRLTEFPTSKTDEFAV